MLQNYSLERYVDGQEDLVMFSKGSDFPAAEDISRSDFFRITLVIKGGGYHLIDNVKYLLKPKHVHLVFPGQEDSFLLEEESCVYSIFIHYHFFSLFTEHFKFIYSFQSCLPVIFLSEFGFKNLVHEYKAIRTELESFNCSLEITRLHLSLIREIIHREAFKYLKVKEKKKNALLTKYVHLVETHFKTEKQVSFYAEQLNVTVANLNLLCKKYLSCTASKLIQNRVIEEAKRIFTYGNMNVKEVGFDLGYEDASYFTRFFKVQTGMLPVQYINLCS
ncbi:MAG: AraC family transcriptional regulator [Sphingobacterium sp.]|jgi:AraC-like DNA-binding protein|nr:AraC family transcriptional regulator [Sphingobacterium sp.]